MDRSLIESFLEGVAKTRALVVGDLMLDEYLWGAVDRISPEAPVQVVEVKGKQTVVIRKIAGRGVEGTQGHDCQSVTPVKDHFISEERMTKRIKCWGTHPAVTMSCGSASRVTEGETFYNSWYA